MRRWNGWGDDTINFAIPQSAISFLESKIGRSITPNDISLKTIIKSVPESRLPDFALLNKTQEERLKHAAGQSLADWIALRGGGIKFFPDAVAFPYNEKDITEIFNFAEQTDSIIIPYGGGTSVVGHLTVPKTEKPVISVDMSRMNKLLSIDKDGNTAAFQAGINGADLEAELRAVGFTLGHFPQSFEYSTLGGWVATRSAGQFSLKYGSIKQLFIGGKIITPNGKIIIPDFPDSAAGPDIKEFILGSEGRLGIITEVKVKISPLPEKEIFHAAFFGETGKGISAVREMAQNDLHLTMIRLSLPEETGTSLSLSNNQKGIKLLNKYLSFRGIRDKKCMLLFGAVGNSKNVSEIIKDALKVIKKYGGIHVGKRPGNEWLKNRFRLPYIRNAMWKKGYAVDTLETAVPWAKLENTINAIENSLKNMLSGYGEKVHVFTHLSHIYSNGSSIYTTFIFRISENPDDTMTKWRILKKAASEAIVKNGGTISHQHGVGIDHLPYLKFEKGELGIKMIRSLCKTTDPGEIMNPGKLID